VRKRKKRKRKMTTWTTRFFLLAFVFFEQRERESGSIWDDPKLDGAIITGCGEHAGVAGVPADCVHNGFVALQHLD